MPPNRPRSDTIWLESHAKEIGFDLCGVVAAEKFPELARSEEWLARGFAGEMAYLADPRRIDASRAMPGIRSVIVCALNYNAPFPRSTHVVGARNTRARLQGASSSGFSPSAGPTQHAAPAELRYDAEQGQANRWVPPQESDGGDDDSPRGWISRYAWGSDYHQVLREKLEELTEAMRHRFRASTIESGAGSGEDFQARVYSDTGPIQERIFAKYAGLGWLAKNTLLLNHRLGSWFFLGAILTTLDLTPTLEEGTVPPPDLCGSCRKCLDACPTNAFPEPYVMDARRCIAYLTIELRGPIPEEFREPMGLHVFGCDICQDVCPWNRRAPATFLQEFQPRNFTTNPAEGTAKHSVATEEAIGQTTEDAALRDATNGSNENSLFLPRLEWLSSLSEQEFREHFRGSAIKRTKWRGLVRNACIALGNTEPQRGSDAYERIKALLQGLSASQDAVIAESALWALRRIE